MGVEHFYLINNNSTDNYQEILKDYSSKVNLYHREKRFVQETHYNDIFEQIKNETEWLIIADLDEYWYSYPKKNIPEVLKDYSGYSGIYTNWQYFGSNGFIDEPESIRKHFTKKWKHNHHTKGIVQCKYTNSLNIHNHNTFGLPSITLTDQLYLNHYGIRSKNRYLAKKSKNGPVANWPPNTTDKEKEGFYSLKYFEDHDKNEMDDFKLRDLLNQYKN